MINTISLKDHRFHRPNVWASLGTMNKVTSVIENKVTSVIETKVSRSFDFKFPYVMTYVLRCLNDQYRTSNS